MESVRATVLTNRSATKCEVIVAWCLSPCGHGHTKLAVTALFFLALAIPSAAQVTVTEAPAVFRLSNGSLTAEINKTTGDMTSLKFNSLELMGFVSGHHAGY